MPRIDIVDTLNTIIRLQADVIDELFILLMQHISVSEANNLPVIKRINEAAALRADIKEYE